MVLAAALALAAPALADSLLPPARYANVQLPDPRQERQAKALMETPEGKKRYLARVAGETAPIMFTAAYVVRDKLPWEGLTKWTDFFFQGVMALPYHIYVVSSKIPQNEYTERVQYGAAFVFLALVMLIALTSLMLILARL